MRLKKFKINKKAVMLCLIGVLFIMCIVFFHENNANKSAINSDQMTYAQLKKENGKESYKNKHPLIRKTIPSNYKKMMDDGHTIQNAENKLLRYASHHKGRLNGNNSNIQTQQNIIRQYVNSNSASDGGAVNYVWTDHFNDKVKIIPGASTATGECHAAFIAYNQSNHRIDNVISFIYDPTEHKFDSFEAYGAYGLEDNTAVAKYNKANKSKKHKRNNHKPNRRNKNQKPNHRKRK